MDGTTRSWLAALLVGVVALPAPVTAHGGVTGEHAHTLPLVVLGVGILLLGASLAADHGGVVDRSTADVGVVAGGVGIVLSLGLLWVL